MSTFDIAISSRVHIPTTLNLLGALYQSGLKVIDEYIDNGLDAGASNIWIVLEPDKVTVTDNGSGMLPDIPVEDVKTLEDFLRGVSQGTEDVRYRVSPLALKSLRWMVEGAALSPKLLERDKRGIHGIGAIAFRLIARSAVWHTRPNSRLAHEYWGESPISANPPTFTLEVPTAEQLSQNILTNKIHTAKEPLRDPRGNLLESGTSVVISQLKDSLRPTLLVDSLSNRFGNDIRSGRLQLTVIDRATDLGKRKDGGIWLSVEPARYQGIGIYDGQGFYKKGEHPFEVKIFYNPRATDQVPQLVRKGAPVGPITNIPELHNVAPWNSGKLAGYIEFTAPDAEAPWLADKSRPQPSPRLYQWLNSVARIGREITEKIAEIEEKRKEKEQSQRTEIVEMALISAMKQLTSFKGISLFLPAPIKREKAKKRKVRRKENLNTYIVVRDQYRRPVRGVQIHVSKNGRFFRDLVSGLTGACSLGVLEKGHYSVALQNEERPYDPHEPQTFEINTKDPKAQITFTIQVPGPHPEDKRISGLTIWLRDLGDPGKLYSIDRLRDWSTVELNIESLDYREAIDSADVEKQVRLQTLYTAMALVEFTFPNEPLEYQFSQLSALFNRAYATALDVLPKRKK